MFRYGRVLERVNNLAPAIKREKARKILGWIGCSPRLLTIQELEQALVIKIGDPESQPLVRSSISIVKLCGPIVEIEDGYVNFVHFTVKE